MTKSENPANVLEYKPIKMFWFLLNAEVYMDNSGAQNLKQLERKIRACVKKSDPDPLIMLFEGSGQKTGTLGVMEKLKPNKCFLNYKEKIPISKYFFKFQ